MTTTIREDRLRLVAMVIMALGALIRVRAWLADIPFNIDEQLLLLNLMLRPVTGFFRPLELAQTAPPVFLVLNRILVSILGLAGPTVRVIALLGSCAAMPLVWGAARRIVAAEGALLALGLLAFAPVQILYANDFKPYALDTF